MIVLLLSVIFVVPNLGTTITRVRVENAILERASQCDRRRYSPHPDFLRQLLDMEKAFGVPDELRGLTLAAACHETGYNPQAKGDHRFSRRRKPKAIGLFQQWRWVEKAYGIDRTDPMQATWAWLTHWEQRVHKVDRDCHFRTPERRWVAAQVTAVRAPTTDRKARCNEQSQHYKRYKRWRRSWGYLLR